LILLNFDEVLAVFWLNGCMGRTGGNCGSDSSWTHEGGNDRDTGAMNAGRLAKPALKR
jgi:hypothetical protein